MPECCGSQTAACSDRFFPPIIWVQRIELRSSELVTSVLTLLPLPYSSPLKLSDYACLSVSLSIHPSIYQFTHPSIQVSLTVFSPPKSKTAIMCLKEKGIAGEWLRKDGILESSKLLFFFKKRRAKRKLLGLLRTK